MAPDRGEGATVRAVNGQTVRWPSKPTMRNGARVGGFTYYEISATPLHRLAHYLTPPLRQVGVDRTYLCLTPNCSFLDISTAILPLALTLADSEPVRVRIKQKMGGRGNSATFTGHLLPRRSAMIFATLTTAKNKSDGVCGEQPCRGSQHGSPAKPAARAKTWAT